MYLLMQETADSGSGGTKGDQLISLIGKDQGNMRKIQAGVVARLCALLGVRWSSSLNLGHVGPMVQEIVVTAGLAGVDSNAKYIELKAASVKGDFYFLQQIQHTQNKTAKNHRDKIQELVVSFFVQTSDPMINSIKWELFEVADGKPIVGHDHPAVQDMMQLPPPYAYGMAAAPVLSRTLLPPRALPRARQPPLSPHTPPLT